MAEPKRNELSVQKKRAILVAVLLPDDSRGDEEPLTELRGLVKTAGVEVVGSLMQKRQKPDHATFLGKGKVEELKALASENDAEIIVFDNSLSPAQGRNLETETDLIIVDRSEIILDIFVTHARTYEARLQVELAQLLYTRPRLKRMWTHLSREGGFGNRGAGEQQIETDRRLIDVRVADLKSKLKEVEKRRERMVSQRREHKTVSLVGYTNAGKSTLMRTLTGADIYVADQLFATLDTRTRAWQLPHWGDVLLSDTVGFIRDLPHNLVASFKSTLEEARNADLLLHVVDASHPAAENQIATVEKVLKEIEVETSNLLLVLNKVDAVKDRSLLDVLRARYPDSVTISAQEGVGLDKLNKAVIDRLSGEFLEADVDANVGNGKLFAFLAVHAEVTNQEYHDSRVTFHCRIPRRFASALEGDDTIVTPVSGSRLNESDFDFRPRSSETNDVVHHG